jgi:hypothetical protein
MDEDVGAGYKECMIQLPRDNQVAQLEIGRDFVVEFIW